MKIMNPPQTRKQELVIRRVFNAPQELVWKAWAEPDYFAQWYGLPNSTLSDVRMDVKSGGTWSAIMHIPDTSDISWKADYIEVMEPERLVFALRNPDDFEDPDQEIISVNLEDINNRTEMIFNQAGNLPPDQYRIALKRGWNAFFDRLDALLDKLSGVTEHV
jgi:uncharacterized protein YndB with AHSA1/START domain